MKRKTWIAIAIALLVVICGVVVYNLVKQEPPVEPTPVVVEEPQEVVEVDPILYNSNRFQDLIDDIVVSIVYTSGFCTDAYPTGERYAYGFNNTVVGRKLVEEGETTTKEKAYDITVEHLTQHVQPFLRYVTREMTDGEIIAVSNFIYSVGGEAFSGHSAKGDEVRKPSRLLVAINEDASPMVCARYFSGFRNSGGMVYDGLLKLRWLQAALFTGLVDPEDLRTACVLGIYGMPLSSLFEHDYPDADGYYSPKLTSENVQSLLELRGTQLTQDLLKF